MVAAVSLMGAVATTLSARAQQCPAPPKEPPTESAKAEAVKRMKGGVAFIELAEGPRYEDAYEQFRQAYVLSGSANALQNLAICASKLELDGEAIECFERYLEVKGSHLPEEERTQVETDLRALQSAVAWVTFSSDLPGVTIDDTRTPRMGSVVRNSYKIEGVPLKVGLHPGNHTFVASLAGKPEQKWTLEVKPGDTITKELVFDAGKPVTAEGFRDSDLAKPTKPAPEARRRGLPGAVWAVGGVTLAAGLGWGVTGGLALSKKSAFEEANTKENLAAGVDLEGQRRTVTTLNLVSDILMGVTAAGAVTTVVLAVVRPGEAHARLDAPRPQLGLAPTWLPGGGGVAAVGSF